ncbi:MAG: hypothetical protein M3340_09055 [Actinomycetota bacterium]|nr:hypothetical protein [Actinomycetota bacterium]
MIFTRTRAMVALGGVAAAAALPSGASAKADEVVRTLPASKHTLSAPAAKRRECARRASTRARGVDTATYRAPMTGYVTVRLAAARGSDWDLALYDRATGRYLSSSAAFGSSEVVQEWVRSGQTLVIQGCRRSGSARTARALVVLADLERPKAPPTASLLRVNVADRGDYDRLQDLGVDVTHEAQDGHADVIAVGDAQRDLLAKNGFHFETRIADLTAHYAKGRQADARFALDGGANLPSGNRSTYRTYEEIQQELKQLSEGYSSIVKPMTLPRKSFQGRPLDGVEIAANVRKSDEDGRPVFLLVAVHHAREWPSAEAAMEYAWMLAKGYGKDDRITSLLKRARVVVVPLINPDGYVDSRTSLDPVDQVYGLGFNPNLDNPTPDPSPDDNDLPTDCLITPVLDPSSDACDVRLSLAEAIAPPGGLFAYRRKNCNGAVNNPGVPCKLQYGVDPNRNYGQLWGGPGSDGDRTSQTYRGPGPWSESETTAVHEYSQRRHVTSLITLHNVAALVLRPPGQSQQGFAPDEAELKKVGDAMGEAAGYTSQYGFQLYDTAGTTEDWNYAAQGAFGYTIEIGPKDGEFHMPYEVGFVEQWNGKYAGNGKGLREALMIGAETAADSRLHSVLDVKAPAGRKLQLRREFDTMTSPYCEEEAKAPLLNYEHPIIGLLPYCVNEHGSTPIPDFLDTSVRVPFNGKVAWHVNPSTRPFSTVERRIPGEIADTPYRSDDYANQVETRSSTVPAEDDPRPTFEDRAFTITAAEGTKRLVASLEFDGATDDYDLELFRRNADGTLESVETSGQPPGLFEQITVEGEDVRPGDYVLRVTNYLALDQGWRLNVQRFTGTPDTVVPPRKESWTLTCWQDGVSRPLETRTVVVDRGQTVSLNLRCRRR